jgi:ATP-binding cassette subfamily B protein AbcA/BmrA
MNKKKINSNLIKVVILSIIVSFVPNIISQMIDVIGSKIVDKDNMNIFIFLLAVFGISMFLNNIIFRVLAVVGVKYGGLIMNENFLESVIKLFKLERSEYNNIESALLYSVIKEYSIGVGNISKMLQYIIQSLIMIVFQYIILVPEIGITAPLINTVAIIVTTLMFFLIETRIIKKSKLRTRDQRFKTESLRSDSINNFRTISFLDKESWILSKIKIEQDKLNKMTNISNAKAKFWYGLTNVISISSMLFLLYTYRNSSTFILSLLVTYGNQTFSIADLISDAIVDINDYNNNLSKLKSILFEKKDKHELKKMTSSESLYLKHVNFKYEGNNTSFYVPEFNMNFTDRVGIIGESGQGKSTILSIINGTNKVNNIDKLYKSYFMCTDTEILNMSLRDNILMGSKLDDEELIELIKDIGLTELIVENDDGLDTRLGDKGIRLSTGQKRRVNILRTIVKMIEEQYDDEKSIMLLDEPIANLDAETAKVCTDMLMTYGMNHPMVVVTHDPILLDLCNKIYKVENHELREV